MTESRKVKAGDDSGQTNRNAETSNDDANAESVSRPRSSPGYHDSWSRNRTMYEEVRETVEGQVSWLREIDDKAMRTLRFNAILLGLVVPVFSFAIEFGLVDGTEAFYNSYTALGIATLLASTALAGLTYTSSSLEAGVSSDDVRTAQRRGLTDEEVHDVLLTSYVQWIRSNQTTVHWNSILITLTVFLTIAAFVSLTLSLASAVLGSVPNSIEYGAYLGLVVVAVLSELI